MMDKNAELSSNANKISFAKPILLLLLVKSLSLDNMLKPQLCLPAPKEEQCFHLDTAIRQRATEIAREAGLIGTDGYEKKGCYKCNGYDKECSSFLNQEVIDRLIKI